jgi:hypothetical protein
MDRREILEIAAAAVQHYAETHPRPSSVTQRDAAEMLGISEGTLRKLVRGGIYKLNALGRIPIHDIDRSLAERG